MRLDLTVRSAAVAAIASLAMAGCGGGGGSSGSGQSYRVSVAVSGLSGTLVVAMGSGTLTFNADGTSSFSSLLPAGSTYVVTVSTQPATQYCTVNNGPGVADADVTADVTCNASPGGVWTGQSQDGNDTYVLMADEQGEFWLLDTDNANGNLYAYGGSLSVSGSTGGAAVSGTDSGEALEGSYDDPMMSLFGTGTLSGSVDPRNALTLTSTFTTSAGTQLQTPSLGTLAYASWYAQGSSYSDVAGDYTETATEEDGTTQYSVAFSITSGGELYGQDTAYSGCVVSGIVAPIAAGYDMYTVEYTYSNCSLKPYNELNGLTYNGIGALAPPNSNLNSSGTAQFITVTAAELTTGYNYATLVLSAN